MERTEELRRLDYQYLWHPFTQMQNYYDEDAPIIERGEGFYLIDTNGKRYIDGISSLWVNIHGHGKRELDNAIIEQLEKVAHTTLLGLGSPPSILLAQKLVELSPPGLSKVFFSDNGSTAVEIALKMAYQYWQQKGKPRRKKFVHFVNSYHGDTIGSVSVGGIDLFHSLYGGLLFETIAIPYPYCYRCPAGGGKEECLQYSVDALEQTLAAASDEVAGVVMEPLVQCAGGMIVAPRGHLAAVRQLCNEYKTLLICDEVAVGIGRTGKMFACEHEDVTPDIIVVAKGLSGGYLPLAATLVTDKIFDGFLGPYIARKTFFHGHTYTGNALGCAVALANLELFEKERLLANLQPKIALLGELLENFKKLDIVGDVRQCGFIVGIELVKNRETKQQFDYGMRVGHRVIVEARKRGAILRPLGDALVIFPPLAIDTETLRRLVEITYDSIAAVAAEVVI